ncbi:MAG: ribosome-associated translation inhibitor RaiA [Zoogloeaceae bacterium]|nr:ribosome-associated translation inhibitor RaiA [Zoogloeaceae bacterium]
MQRAVQITFKDFPHSDAVETHIREKVAKLETFYPHIIGCHVTVELPHRHHQQGKLHNVRIDMKVPGGVIAVNRDQHEDLYVALRDAFDAAKRQVEEHGQRQRGDVKRRANTRLETAD